MRLSVANRTGPARRPHRPSGGGGFPRGADVDGIGGWLPSRSMNPARILAAVSRRTLLADVVLAAALAALAAVTGLVLVAPRAQTPPPTPAIVVWALALAAPLVLRRRWPLAVLAVTAVSFTRYWAVGQPNEIASWLVLGVAVYSAAAYGSLRRGAWVCGACLLWLVGSGVLPTLRAGAGTVELAAVALFDSLPFLLGWSLGVMTRRLREYRATLEERNRQLDQQQEANARRAVLEERVRIARELHDVVAHHVSLMGIQAGVARRLFDRDPAEAVAAIASVETASRQAIAELQQLVGVLRGRGEGDDLAPQPGLERLPELVEHMRQAGLPVELRQQGRPRRLPAGVELSVYRIVQEALTNTLKHAGPAHASVTVCYHHGMVEVEVVDDGSGPAPGRSATGGRGLVGMRERVGLYGGRLEAGAGPGGGFRVHAVLRDGGP
jgi:signal transduction histidine kinase